MVVPDAFCDDPGTSLLTVMRSRMNWRRRWLKLTKKDLAVFEVAIVGPAEVSDELVEHINHNTDDIGDNEVAIGVNTTAIAALGAAHPVDLEDDVTWTLDEGARGTGQAAGYTKGDFLIATAAGTLVKLAVGSNTQVLTADAGEASGVKWEAAGGGGSGTDVTFYKAAECNALAASVGSNWETDNTNQALAFCSGTKFNIFNGSLTYVDTKLIDARLQILLPTSQTGTIDIRIFWSANVTSGNVVWRIATVCAGNDDPTNTGFNPDQLVTDAAGSANNALMIATLSSITLTGCSAGDAMAIQVGRDGNDAADTIGASVNFFGIEVMMTDSRWLFQLRSRTAWRSGWSILCRIHVAQAASPIRGMP